jgi:uncharacterized repeat protein (TIGR04076 family)
MGPKYDVRITLIAQKKRCPSRHQVGDQFIVGRTTPEGMCSAAFNSLMPFITTLRFGGEFPWSDDPDAGVFCCPDADVVNTWRIERITEESPK